MELLDIVMLALQHIRDVHWCIDLDGILIRLESILQCLLWVEPFFMPSDNFTTLLSAVSDMISEIKSSLLEQSLIRCPGRPRLDISENQLSIFLEQEFTQVEIAQMFGCSPKTIHRRIIQFRLSSYIQYSMHIF